MTVDIAQTVRAVLSQIAPNADVDHADPDESLQEQLELDSMDFLNFVTELHERLGVDVPERDYPKLDSVAGAVGYLEHHLAARA